MSKNSEKFHRDSRIIMGLGVLIAGCGVSLVFLAGERTEGVLANIGAVAALVGFGIVFIVGTLTFGGAFVRVWSEAWRKWRR